MLFSFSSNPDYSNVKIYSNTLVSCSFNSVVD